MRAQIIRITLINAAFAVEAQQPSSKHPAQSPSANQQQPVLRANATSHRVQCMGWKGAPVATRENRLQLLHGGLKRVQERGARYQVSD
jgi:adenylyl- and sulfurtransferase ThiI